MKWHKSLVFKIILCCIVLILCLIGSIFGVLYRYQESILAEMEEKSSEVLRGIQVQLTNLEVEATPPDILESRLSDLKTEHGVDAILLYDSQRKLVSRIQSEQIPLLEFGDPGKAQVGNIPWKGGDKLTLYFQTFPLMVGQNPVGYVKIALAIAPQTHLVKTLRSKVLVSLVILFLGTICALCYFIFQLLQPLRTMAATCQEISEGNLYELDIKPNASEVLALEMKFNEMVQSLRMKAKMEQKLAQAQRNSALGNLAAGVAHEIGNPLNGIKLTISHLKDLFFQRELDEDSFKRYTAFILKEVNRLDEIVRDFLMLAKERELSLRPCRVDTLLGETVHLIEKEAQKRKMAITTDIADCAQEILVDPQLLKGAILNILINAMEASHEGGEIHVGMTRDDGRVIINITDHGEGIPPEAMEHIFDPYFSTKESGTGLGLSLTKTIAEKHEGEISIESSPGRGASVTLTIPEKRR